MKSVSKKDVILAYALKQEYWRPAWSKLSKATGIPISTIYSHLQFEKFELRIKHMPKKELKCLNPDCKNTVKTKGWCSVECHAEWAKGDEL